MNDTKIEWCESTWNPVTGCRHGCPYCYARGIAQRFSGYWDETKLRSCGGNGKIHELVEPMFRHTTGKNRSQGVHSVQAPYPYRFDPTFHRYRLDEPAQKTRGRTIFVCSMADLFGKWVPTSWIVEVLDACKRAPQHRYLFLTKNPERYMELDGLALLPREENFWYGSTTTTGDEAMFHSEFHNCFVSIEPIHAPFGSIDRSALPGIKWYILGAETGNRADKIKPERSWVEPIVKFCKDNRKPLFMKDSMASIWDGDLITEFPWENGKEDFVK